MKVEVAEDFSMGSWNHRVIKHGDGTLEIVEAHYIGKLRRLRGHGKPFTTGDNLDELRELLGRMGRALKKEILLCQCCKHDH